MNLSIDMNMSDDTKGARNPDALSLGFKSKSWKVLILGSGGREAAIYKKLAKSQNIEKLFALPGNAGTANALHGKVDNIPAIIETVKKENFDLVVVGAEVPLCMGIVDEFAKALPHVKIFGPDKYAAQLEGSKIFSHRFMSENDIPTAKGTELYQPNKSILENHSLPIVIKADGLAAGKGVSIHHSISDAEKKVSELLEEKILGESGASVLLQECLTGTEASLFALMNGSDALILPTARDYKRAYDKDEGPNTGGMGSYSPGNHLSDEHIAYAREKIIEPILQKFHYKGVLYIGLMVHSAKYDDLSVIEFNCRFGDPETQSILPRIEGDLLEYILWSTGMDIPVMRIRNNGFDSVPASKEVCFNVVLAAKGYPGSYKKGIEIHLPHAMPQGIHIIHAGTESLGKTNNDGAMHVTVKSNGGRIINIVGRSDTIENAKERVYDFIEVLRGLNDFTKIQFRTDIGVQ